MAEEIILKAGINLINDIVKKDKKAINLFISCH